MTAGRGPGVVRLDRRLRYTVAGQDGTWRYAGQATYTDDDGRAVDHDYVRMVQGDAEVWVDPAEVTGVIAGGWSLTVLGDGVIAG